MSNFKIILTFTLSILLATSYGQNSDWKTYKKKEKMVDSDSIDTLKRELNYNGNSGVITINQDSKIDSLTNKIGRNPFINGYTIQIEVSQQKAIIRDARYLFIKHYPDVPIDEEYDQPNTYLFGGRFYDKNSAYEFQHKIRNDFPDAIVIQKKLSLPPLNNVNE